MSHHGLKILPGVAVIIFNEEGSILLQKRADVGLWGLPSGHVEPGETVREAAIREVKEETGLEIDLVRFIGVYSDPASQIFHFPDGRKVHFITSYFEGKANKGSIDKYYDQETLALAYFDRAYLPQNMLTMHPKWIEDALNDEEGPFVR